MSDALRQLHAAANVLADSGLRTVKTNDLCIAVYGAIDEITRLREALEKIASGQLFQHAHEFARAALAEKDNT
jgi:hypothetical protein